MSEIQHVSSLLDKSFITAFKQGYYWTTPLLPVSCQPLLILTATPITLSDAAAKDIDLTETSLPSHHTFASLAFRPPFPLVFRLFGLTPGPHTYACRCSGCVAEGSPGSSLKAYTSGHLGPRPHRCHKHGKGIDNLKLMTALGWCSGTDPRLKPARCNNQSGMWPRDEWDRDMSNVTWMEKGRCDGSWNNNNGPLVLETKDEKSV